MHSIAYSSRIVATILVLIGATSAVPAQDGVRRDIVVTVVGPEQVMFSPKRHACDGHDVPDMPLRAWRGADGAINAFALHHENRRLTGPSLLALKPDCTVVFRGNRKDDPRAYDDLSWITATWTGDGTRIHGLVHHEFQAHAHKGRCTSKEYMACWWNSILRVTSGDSGRSFVKTDTPVMAATPQPSEVGQGRHRGFFNPSNIIAQDGAYYTLIGTTGWNGQPGGVCLFRSTNLDAGEWRAFDGRGFEARFPDPYSEKNRKPARCEPLAPFPAPVGSIVRHAASGLYVAMFQAKSGMPDGQGGSYAQSGFYSATSRDLIRWGEPRLVMPTPSLYDDACGQGMLRSYPVLIDPDTKARNFEESGDSALLTFTAMRIDGCAHTGDRSLIARKVRISIVKVE